MQQVIKQSILARGYIGYDQRFYSKYSINDMAWAVMGIHPLFNHQVIERVQQEMGLDDTTVQYGSPLSLEQIEQLATLFAQSGFSLRMVTYDCMDCGIAFDQLPHPYSEQAFYYTCPQCRQKTHEQTKNLPARHSAGIYRGVKQ